MVNITPGKPNQPFNASGGGPIILNLPPNIPMPPPGTYGGWLPPPPSINPTSYGLPTFCPNCGDSSAVYSTLGPTFNCGFPFITPCRGNRDSIKVKEVEEPNDCVCHITILVSRGCQSNRGLPCPSRKKK